MKKAIVIAIVSLFGSTIFACPDLVGTWNCTFPDGDKGILDISQHKQAGVTVYNFDGNEMIADGKLHKMGDTEDLKKMRYKSTCKNAKRLNFIFMADVYQSGSKMGSYKEVSKIVRAAKSFKINAKGVYTSNDGSKYEQKALTKCSLN